MIITLATSKYWKKGKKKHCSKAFQLGNYIATIIMNESFPCFTWNYHLIALSRAIKLGAIVAKAVQNSRHREHSTLQQGVRISSYSSMLKVSGGGTFCVNL
jgi:hypothetical protein